MRRKFHGYAEGTQKKQVKNPCLTVVMPYAIPYWIPSQILPTLLMLPTLLLLPMLGLRVIVVEFELKLKHNSWLVFPDVGGVREVLMSGPFKWWRGASKIVLIFGTSFMNYPLPNPLIPAAPRLLGLLLNIGGKFIGPMLGGIGRIEGL